MSNNPRDIKGRWTPNLGGGGAASLTGADSRAEFNHLIHRSLIEARESLCAALDSLSAHQDGIVVIGSQAVYERTKSLQIMSPQTKDADIVIVPSLVSGEPNIEEIMRASGFRPLGEFEEHPRHKNFQGRPGLWGKGFTAAGEPIAEVDLIAPAALSGGGRRAPRSMSTHGKSTVGMAEGVELATQDFDRIDVASFIDGSVRTAKVAGYAALLCAKSFKIAERATERDNGGRNRVLAKDAGDAWRLIASSDPRDVATVFSRLSSNEEIGAVARRGIEYLRSLDDSSEILSLANLDLRHEVEPDEIKETYQAWMSTFLARL
jgi:hypothetical protein